MSENLRNLTRSVYGFDAVVQRVGDDQWDMASKCDEWTARELVAHQAGVLGGLAEIARSGEMVLPLDVDADDPRGVWAHARDDVLEALDHEGVLETEGGFWFGPMTIDQLVGAVTWDPLLHSWDLGTAVGVDPCIDPALAEWTIAVAGSIAPRLRKLGMLADEVQVAADADALTRLLGLTGRNPAG